MVQMVQINVSKEGLQELTTKWAAGDDYENIIYAVRNTFGSRDGVLMAGDFEPMHIPTEKEN